MYLVLRFIKLFPWWPLVSCFIHKEFSKGDIYVNKQLQQHSLLWFWNFCLYGWREENSNNNLHPKLNMCIFLNLYFEIKHLKHPRCSHLSPLQHEIEPPLSSFFFIGHSLPKNGILCIDIFFLGSATFWKVLRQSLKHFQRYIFHDQERYN